MKENTFKQMAKEEIIDLNQQMPWQLYLDINDKNGVALYDEDKLLGYPKNIGELVYMAYKCGWDESQNKVKNILNSKSMEITETIIQMQATMHELRQEQRHDFWGFTYTKPDKLKANSYVYFLHAGEFIKIGFSAKPHERISTLQTGSPHKLQLVLVIEGGKEKESELHGRFNKWRYHGEWFYYSDEIKSFVLESAKNSGFIEEAV